MPCVLEQPSYQELHSPALLQQMPPEKVLLLGPQSACICQCNTKCLRHCAELGQCRSHLHTAQHSFCTSSQQQQLVCSGNIACRAIMPLSCSAHQDKRLYQTATVLFAACIDRGVHYLYVCDE